MSVSDEISSNFLKFEKKWWDETVATRAINIANPSFAASYPLLAAFNALRENIITPKTSQGAMDFLLEAQNDGLTSLVLAQLGIWRTSLQSLRSFIENCLNGLYFADHPIELLRWNAGKFKTSFSELSKYFEQHPLVPTIPAALNAIPSITSEYATLSKAVHGSAKTMWMSADGAVKLATDDAIRLGQWNTRFAKVLRAGLIMIVTIYRSELTGAQNLGTRATLGLALTATQKNALKSSLKISLPTM